MTDGKELYNLLMRHLLIGFFESHIHVNETYCYKDASFIDNWVVCGAWWKGARDGHPERFNLVACCEDSIETEYITYSWDASRYAEDKDVSGAVYKYLFLV